MRKLTNLLFNYFIKKRNINFVIMPINKLFPPKPFILILQVSLLFKNSEFNSNPK